ncbi:MAG TPA: class I SAM-dependent methyltransferase [Thermoanaerobaculia bacterium]
MIWFRKGRNDPIENLKASVREYWNAEPCGTRDVAAPERRAYFDRIERERYEMQPYIHPFARFAERARGVRMLEVGVGAGTDFINWVRNGAKACGVDLSDQSLQLTRERVLSEGLHADLHVADAEQLPFQDESFDLVYSFGVLHHSPDTPRAINEVHRVLKPGGRALIMVYHPYGWVGLLLWLFHGVAKLRPWRSPRWAMFHHLESPGTKAYTEREVRKLFARYSDVTVERRLSTGDLLLMSPSGKYSKGVAGVIWKLYPRWFVRLLGERFGTDVLIEARK